MAEVQHKMACSPEVLGRSFRMLYIEDAPSDVALVREALRDFKPRVELTVFDRGIEALEYLRRNDRDKRALRPHLILLDLNLPAMSGDEFLAIVKADPRLRTLPIVVFTSAATETLCKPIYREYANSCVRKEIDFDNFLCVVRKTCDYWFTVANVPDPE